MKKLLLFISFIFIFPAWAMCSIDSGESLCILPNSSSSGMPLLTPQNNAGLNSDKNMGSTGNNLQPSSLNSSFSKVQNQSGIHMQGSLGCQFGNCNKGSNNDVLENQ